MFQLPVAVIIVLHFAVTVIRVVVHRSLTTKVMKSTADCLNICFLIIVEYNEK
jgi:multisubunit Na+/H+ antiporter MnhF subunit